MSYRTMKQRPNQNSAPTTNRVVDQAAQCEGKRAFDSYTAAAGAIRSMSRRGSVKKNNVYKCRFCQSWHIGKRKD